MSHSLYRMVAGGICHPPEQIKTAALGEETFPRVWNACREKLAPFLITASYCCQIATSIIIGVPEKDHDIGLPGIMIPRGRLTPLCVVCEEPLFWRAAARPDVSPS